MKCSELCQHVVGLLDHRIAQHDQSGSPVIVARKLEALAIRNQVLAIQEAAVVEEKGGASCETSTRTST